MGPAGKGVFFFFPSPFSIYKKKHFGGVGGMSSSGSGWHDPNNGDD